MKKKFDDDHAVAREIALETTDIFESFLPDIFRNERFWKFLRGEQMFMCADDEYFLVIRAVEDADFASLRHSLMRAPEIIVIEFLWTRRLEGMNVAALRVYARHDVFDRAIFSCGVHGLYHDEQGPAVLCVEFFLHATQQLHAVVEHFRRSFFRMQLAGVGRIEVLQTKALPLCDSILIGKFSGRFGEFAILHGVRKFSTEARVSTSILAGRTRRIESALPKR